MGLLYPNERGEKKKNLVSKRKIEGIFVESLFSISIFFVRDVRRLRSNSSSFSKNSSSQCLNQFRLLNFLNCNSLRSFYNQTLMESIYFLTPSFFFFRYKLSEFRLFKSTCSELHEKLASVVD